jgi:hypothetical protein
MRLTEVLYSVAIVLQGFSYKCFYLDDGLLLSQQSVCTFWL